MAQSGICAWGPCTCYETPIVVNNDDKKRLRFCCHTHLAMWACKQAIKNRGVTIDNSKQERLIDLRIDELVTTFAPKPPAE